MQNKMTPDDVWEYIFNDDLESFKCYVDNSKLILRDGYTMTSLSLRYETVEGDYFEYYLNHLINLTTLRTKEKIATYLILTFRKEFQMIEKEGHPRDIIDKCKLDKLNKLMKKIEIYE